MEKLIELLNEYAHTYADHYDDTGEEIETTFIEHADECFIYCCDGKFDSLVDDVVISKRFGFVKWLVENDKIDRQKVGLKIKDMGDGYGWFAIYSGIHIECLLMLLSISDNPIDLLVSMLK